LNKDFNEKIEMLSSEIEKNLKLIYNLKISKKSLKPIEDKVWELSKEKYVLETRSTRNFKQYKGIIFTVGFTPEPIILNILANEPQAVYFIHTKESEKHLDRIIEETNLKASQFKRGIMPKDSVLTSFRLVKKGLNFLIEEKEINKNEVAIDPTGGTKIMSVGCGFSTSIMDLNIIYISNKKYNPILRRPEPGSEHLVNIPNLKDILLGDKLIEDINISKNKIKRISQHFEDVTNTHVVLLMKKSGEHLSDIRYLESHNLDGDIFSGLIAAISNLGEEVGEQISFSQGDTSAPELTINYRKFKINIMDGEFIRVAIISDQEISDLIKEKSQVLVDEYEELHMVDLKLFSGNITQFKDFPAMAKKRLDLGLNEKNKLNINQLYKYDKNSMILYVLKNWYEKMKIESNLTSFYPVMIPKILMRELGMEKDEAHYWTYDLFKNNVIINGKGLD